MNWQQITALIAELTAAAVVVIAAYKVVRKFENMAIEGEKRKKENYMLIKFCFVLCESLTRCGINGKIAECKAELEDFVIKN